jgi:hypothetical protein
MPDPAAQSSTPSLAALQKLTEAGYAYYRDTNRQRSDDMFVRARAADALARAASRLAEAVQTARRAIPPATREQPFADPVLLTGITRLREQQSRLASLETRLRGPAALPDRDFASLRASPAQCDRLVQLDAALLEAAEAPDVENRLDALEAALDQRAALSNWNQKR